MPLGFLRRKRIESSVTPKSETSVEKGRPRRIIKGTGPKNRPSGLWSVESLTEPAEASHETKETQDPLREIQNSCDPKTNM